MSTYKTNKTVSFVIVFAVYCIATAVGIFVYNLLPFSFWLNLLIADVDKDGNITIMDATQIQKILAGID